MTRLPCKIYKENQETKDQEMKITFSWEEEGETGHELLLFQAYFEEICNVLQEAAYIKVHFVFRCSHDSITPMVLSSLELNINILKIT